MAKTSMAAALKKGPVSKAAETVAAHGKEVTMREIPPKPRGEAPAKRVDPFAAAIVAAAASGMPVEVRPGYKLVKAREVLPHVSVYLHPKAIAKFKEIAAVDGRKAHAVYLEALDHYLRTKHGISLDSLGGE